MPTVTSTVHLDFRKVKLLEKSAIKALAMTGEYVHTELVQSQTMPFDTGNLQNESTFMDDSESASGKVSVVSNTPYARRLYYHPEYNFKKDENPFAGGEWFKPWEADGQRSGDVTKAFSAFYKRLTGV